MGLLDHIIVLLFIFLGIFILFITVATAMHTLTNSVPGFPFFRILCKPLGFCFVFGKSPTIRCEMIPYCSIALHVPK